MTITFQPQGRDNLNFFRHAITKTVLGACGALFVLSLPLIIFFGAILPVSISDPHDKLPLAETLAMLLVPYVLLGLGVLLGVAITPYAALPMTVTLSPECCRVEAIFAQDIPWRSFKGLTEDAGYFYFASWKRTVFVPVSAFPNRAAADAFFQSALSYWREAKAATKPMP